MDSAQLLSITEKDGCATMLEVTGFVQGEKRLRLSVWNQLSSRTRGQQIFPLILLWTLLCTWLVLFFLLFSQYRQQTEAERIALYPSASASYTAKNLYVLNLVLCWYSRKDSSQRALVLWIILLVGNVSLKTWSWISECIVGPYAVCATSIIILQFSLLLALTHELHYIWSVNPCSWFQYVYAWIM